MIKVAEEMDLGQSCKVLTWNVRGVKGGGFPLISQHLKYFQISFGGKVFMSDLNGESRRMEHPRSGGVITIIHGSCPVQADAAVVSSATIPNRYLLVRMHWGPSVCYIHNIYAPNDAAARKLFFQKLPVSFEANAVHIICGDFNMAVDPAIDAILSTPRLDSSRAVLLNWLTELNVVDAWRLHHPQERVYSGPIPRRNRIDYIFLSDTLLTSSYNDSSYNSWENGGDHLAHQVDLTSFHHPMGTGYWKLPSWLLKIPELRLDIANEAKGLLPVIRQSSNPGLVWKSWKHKMKVYLKHCQRSLRSSAYADIEAARRRVEECAAAAAQPNAPDEADIDLYFARQNYKETKEEWSAFRRDTGFEQMVTASETSSSFSFALLVIPYDQPHFE